jgi:hypothetical protein
MRGVGSTFEVMPALPETRYFYGLDRTATATLPDPNNSGGIALPVPPGFLTCVAFHDGTEVARVSRVPVRAGAATIVALLPR